MPSDKKAFDNKVYQNEYHKGMKHKLISFNPNSPEDMELWSFLMGKGKGNVTPYIKRLIREDMGKGRKPPQIHVTLDEFKKIITPDVIPFPDEEDEE